MIKKRFISMLALLMVAVTGAWAQEQSETIVTTDYIVEGTHFTISCNDSYADGDGMIGTSGITVTPKNGETITKVVISCTYDSDEVNDGNTSVSSGTKEITNDGGTITVTGVNASTFTFTCSDDFPQFGQFVVYYTEAPTAPTGYTVSMKEGTEDATSWTIAPAEATTTGVEAGTTVTATYSGAKKVKSVKAKKKAAAGPTYNETKSINDGPVTVAAGEHWLITGTGTQTSNTMSIGAGATVTLDGVNISSSGYCIKCAGDATIILKDGSTNTLTGTGSDYPALSAGDAGTTLTIQGSTGALNVQQSGDYCAGIGGGYSNTNNTCGNIRIEGGVITVQGGHGGAGIGTDANPATCGDIIITGGTITATGGNYAAGIGSGDSGSCGTVTITDGVTSVTATKGNNADYSIGAGFNGSCGTVTIGGTEYPDGISTSPFTYPAPAAKAAAEATAEDKGKLIGTDGKIYADVAAATAAGTTAVAKIIYLGTTGHSTYTHGLALALTDEASKMEWQDAINACSAKNTSTPVTNATWLLASKDQWNYMLDTNGAGSYTALRDGFSSVGGSNLQSDESARYWSSTVFDSTQAWRIYFYNGIWNFDYKDESRYVRACLAF